MTDTDRLIEAVGHLNGAISNCRLYSAEHPQAVRYLQRALEKLVAAFADRGEVTLLIVDDDVVMDNRPLGAHSPQLTQFIRVLQRCAIERVTFTREVTLEQLSRFVRNLADIEQDVVHSTPGIRLGKVQVLTTPDALEGDGSLAPEIRQRLSELAVVRQKSLDDLKEIYGRIRATKEISSHGLGAVVQGFLQGMLHNVNPLQMLATLKEADEYTYTHAINVCILTMAQAESLGIGGRQLHDIGVAAAMHDAGKMFVPEEILNKPDKLTDREWVHMKNHSRQGAQYILRLPGIPKLAFLAALEHHIRYDGSGYPRLGEAWRPNIVSQMVALADFFDAMRSRRVYKNPKPDELIIRIMREESGKTFHPRLVENFLRLLETSP